MRPDILKLGPKSDFSGSATKRCHMIYKDFLVFGLAMRDVDECKTVIDTGHYPRLDMDVAFKFDATLKVQFNLQKRTLKLSDNYNSYIETGKNTDYVNKWLAEKLQARGYNINIPQEDKVERPEAFSPFPIYSKLRVGYKKDYQDREINYCNIFYKDYLVINLKEADIDRCIEELKNGGRNFEHEICFKLDEYFTMREEPITGHYNLTNGTNNYCVQNPNFGKTIDINPFPDTYTNNNFIEWYAKNLTARHYKPSRILTKASKLKIIIYGFFLFVTGLFDSLFGQSLGILSGPIVIALSLIIIVVLTIIWYYQKFSKKRHMVTVYRKIPAKNNPKPHL